MCGGKGGERHLSWQIWPRPFSEPGTSILSALEGKFPLVSVVTELRPMSANESPIALIHPVTQHSLKTYCVQSTSAG